MGGNRVYQEENVVRIAQKWAPFCQNQQKRFSNRASPDTLFSIISEFSIFCFLLTSFQLLMLCNQFFSTKRFL